MPLTCIQNDRKGECHERTQRQADKIIEGIQEGHLGFNGLGSRGKQICAMKRRALVL